MVISGPNSVSPKRKGGDKALEGDLFLYIEPAADAVLLILCQYCPLTKGELITIGSIRGLH